MVPSELPVTIYFFHDHILYYIEENSAILRRSS